MSSFCSGKGFDYLVQNLLLSSVVTRYTGEIKKVILPVFCTDLNLDLQHGR
jgi:hypothetical protein